MYIEAIEVPTSLGNKKNPGTFLAPAAIRFTGLYEDLNQDGHQVFREEVSPHQLADYTMSVMERKGYPLFIGGDHSIALGALEGIYKHLQEPPFVVWIDAHADINSPISSLTGNEHGMPVHFALEAGYIVPERFVYIGLRDIDPYEKKRIKDLDLAMVWAIELCSEVEASYKKSGASHLHISFDIDVLDPGIAPGVSTPSWGGLDMIDVKNILSVLKSDSFLMAEVNTLLDVRNQTAQVASKIIREAIRNHDAN